MATGSQSSTRTGLLVVIAALLVATEGCRFERVKTSKTKSTMDNLTIALTNYERDVGSFEAKLDSGDQMPTGLLHDASKRAKVIQILTGKKPDGTVDPRIRADLRWNGPYLEPSSRELKNGQLVDAWGNPLMIRIKRRKYDAAMRYKPDSFEIYSLGPNGKDESGSGDDINNWDL